ncbi:hypothetical protein PACTADRAFT_84440 [Pachysolen tannophilus NRRL Y-2460]|uniref:mRNA-capping enzyme subunit alpha n=1 Tax=Pachysolen tannophilus NRRL Y-2460 TaxID=669874 RepID=A0A1E4TZM3_PACTA|nr:hypothetical protein PACTADRAFT_84440 [Pachysolen tannophilus NRRL Y-2460]
MDDREMPEIPGVVIPEDVSDSIKLEVSRILHCRRNDFPGSQPVSFERKHIPENLMKKDYFVCEKSDGLRCLLLALVNKETGEEGCFLITRGNEYHLVEGFHFPTNTADFAEPHDGTILDGELVISTNPITKLKELRYLIFDCLSMNKRSVMMKNLGKRLYLAQHDFYLPFQKMRKEFPDRCVDFPFKIDFKNMTQSYKVSKIFKEMKNLTYISDGLIFTCCETPYVSNSDPTLLKWKPAEENTIDFKIKLEIPIFEDPDLPEHDPDKFYKNYDVMPVFKLLIWEGGDDMGQDSKHTFNNYSEYSELYIDDKEWESLQKLNEPLNGRIVEARKDQNGRWRMLRFRDDKANGNHSSVVLKILNSIQDSVKREELIEAEPQIRKNWEEREQRRKEADKARILHGHNIDDHHDVNRDGNHSHAEQPHPQQPLQPKQLENKEHQELQDQNSPQNQAPKRKFSEDDNYDDDDNDFDDIPTYEKSVSPKYGDSDNHEDTKRQKT